MPAYVKYPSDICLLSRIDLDGLSHRPGGSGQSTAGGQPGAAPKNPGKPSATRGVLRQRPPSRQVPEMILTTYKLSPPVQQPSASSDRVVPCGRVDTGSAGRASRRRRLGSSVLGRATGALAGIPRTQPQGPSLFVAEVVRRARRRSLTGAAPSRPRARRTRAPRRAPRRQWLRRRIRRRLAGAGTPPRVRRPSWQGCRCSP